MLNEDQVEPFDESDEELDSGERSVEQESHDSDSAQSETDSGSSSSEYYLGKE